MSERTKETLTFPRSQADADKLVKQVASVAPEASTQQDEVGICGVTHIRLIAWKLTADEKEQVEQIFSKYAQAVRSKDKKQRAGGRR